MKFPMTPGTPKFRKIPTFVLARQLTPFGVKETPLIVKGRYWDTYKGWIIVGFAKDGTEKNFYESECSELGGTYAYKTRHVHQMHDKKRSGKGR